MEPTKLEKIISRINQLRALSKSTHSKNEKEAAIAAAQRLIVEYQLSEAEIEIQSGKTDEEVITDQSGQYNVVYETGRATEWKQSLVFGLAKLNGLYALKFAIRHDVSHRQGSRYRVFGRKSDIEITKYMFDYLVEEISRLSFDYIPRASATKRGVNPVRESWCLGCVQGFLAKMRSEKESVMRTATSSAIVLVGNRSDEAKKALIASDPKMRIGNITASKSQLTADTYNSGFRKGQTLNVNPGMGGSSGEVKKLR